MIIKVPRALISGLIEIFSIDRIWVGMVSTPGRAPEHAGRDVVEGNGEDEQQARPRWPA